MSKKKTALEIAKEEAGNAIKRTNSRIDELGKNTKNLYNSLTNIQALFDKIRNVPSEKRLQYENLKKLCLTWKQQADKIEADYNAAVAKSGGTAGGGAALGVGIAALGPSAAMGIATTFGVASTGTAISSLSGAAATNAALAWLGGGALATGGGGMAAGETFLAMAGPVGWTIAAVTLTIGGIMFWIAKQNKKRLENIYILISKRDVKSYDLATVEINERIAHIIDEIPKLHSAAEEIVSFGTDYSSMTEQQQYTLGSYVNLMLASTNLLVNPILGLQAKFTNDDLKRYESSLFGDEKILIKPILNSFNVSQKGAIVSLANLLYKIDMDEKDKHILYKSLRKNKTFLESCKLEKKEFEESILIITMNALEHKYVS